MIVSATELANDSKAVLDRVAHGGETVEVQRHGKTVAEIQRKAGASRGELLRLLRGRGFTETDSRELKRAMDAASAVFLQRPDDEVFRCGHRCDRFGAG